MPTDLDQSPAVSFYLDYQGPTIGWVKVYVSVPSVGAVVLSPCRLATTANLGLSGLAAIDGVTPAGGDRILVKDQTDAKQNGIWLANGGAWTRATDTISYGFTTVVEEGTINGRTVWMVTTASTPVSVGTVDLNFAVIASSGASS
jgi:phage-related tail fiber protein